MLPKPASVFILCVLIFSTSFSQNCTNTSVGFTPINDLGTGFWHGLQGGLYPNGQNSRPVDHNLAGLDIASHIVPLNMNGDPDAESGKVVFIGVGMSNTQLEFDQLMFDIDTLRIKNRYLKAIDGALGGWDINSILDSSSSYWDRMTRVLADSGLTNKQVQAVWFKEAEDHPSDTTFPDYADSLKEKFKFVMHILVGKFPNVKLCYVASRIYAGYSTSPLNPEPFAYYQGWAVKRLIEDQIAGDTALVYGGPKPRAPWLSWGVYQWADGLVPRSDGLTWVCPDDYQADGTHPSDTGREKVAHMLLDFFTTDETTRPWFTQLMTTSVEPKQREISDYTLSQNYPNPFNPTTTINYQVKALSRVSIKIYDVLGKEIMSLVDQIQTPGSHEAVLNASALPSGVYFYRMRAGTFTETRRLMLLK